MSSFLPTCRRIRAATFINRQPNVYFHSFGRVSHSAAAAAATTTTVVVVVSLECWWLLSTFVPLSVYSNRILSSFSTFWIEMRTLSVGQPIPAFRDIPCFSKDMPIRPIHNSSCFPCCCCSSSTSCYCFLIDVRLKARSTSFDICR